MRRLTIGIAMLALSSSAWAETRAPVLRRSAPAPTLRMAAPILRPEAPSIHSPATIRALFQTPTAELKRDATEGLTGAEQARLQRVIDLLKAGKQEPAMGEWQVLLRQVSGPMSPGGGQNIMAMLFYVMRESIVEQQEDKRYWLKKLQNQNAIAEALSDYLKELNKALAGQDDDESGGPLRRGARRRATSWQITVRAPVVLQLRGAPPKFSYRTKRLTSERQVRAEIADCEKRLKSNGDMTQMMLLDLQQTMQKQQQAFQILSSIMKNMHDTAKAIIRNMR